MDNVLPVLVPAIGWALLHFVWQGLLIGWGAALALNLLRGARPQVRYLVACAALLLCAALPLASIAWHLLESGAMVAPLNIALVLPFADGLGAATTAAPGASSGQGGWLAPWEFLLNRQLPWLVMLWLCGAALMTLRLAVGLKWVAARTGPGNYTINHYWQRRLSLLARRFEIPQHVRFGVTELLDSPITAGCWRPIVLVPAALVSGCRPIYWKRCWRMNWRTSNVTITSSTWYRARSKSCCFTIRACGRCRAASASRGNRSPTISPSKRWDNRSVWRKPCPNWTVFSSRPPN